MKLVICTLLLLSTIIAVNWKLYDFYLSTDAMENKWEMSATKVANEIKNGIKVLSTEDQAKLVLVSSDREAEFVMINKLTIVVTILFNLLVLSLVAIIFIGRSHGNKHS